MRINLVLGLVWLTWFLIQFFTSDNFQGLDYFWLLISITYLGLYFYQRQRKYLTLADRKLKVHDFPEKEVHLDEIREIRKFAGDYIIKSGEKKMVINTLIMDSEDLELLTAELQKLSVEWS